MSEQLDENGNPRVLKEDEVALPVWLGDLFNALGGPADTWQEVADSFKRFHIAKPSMEYWIVAAYAQAMADKQDSNIDNTLNCPGCGHDINHHVGNDHSMCLFKASCECTKTARDIANMAIDQVRQDIENA